MEKRLIGVEEAKVYLGIPKGTIYNLVSQRRIPFVKIGRRTLFDLQEINRWIVENARKEEDFEKDRSLIIR